MDFEFATSGRMVFGRGKAAQAAQLTSGWGGRAAWVKGRSSRFDELILTQYRAAGVELVPLSIQSEPTVAWAQEALAQLRDARVGFVLAVGGGSVLDAGKALAALLANPGEPLDYLEVVGRGLPLKQRSLPLAALPTTAGTGSEMTRNAVLRSREHGVKASLRSASMLPALALVDSSLTDTLGPQETATTGMDALTQLLEPLVCSRANPMVDALAVKGLELVARSLRKAVTAPSGNARDDMALASTLGGMCLANAGLGAVHGIAAVVGGRYDAPHGAVCAALLGPVVACNLAALRISGDPKGTRSRYALAAGLLGCGEVDDLPVSLTHLAQELGVPGLGAFGVKPEAAFELAKLSLQSSSMKANPVALEVDGLVQAILEAL